MLFDSANPVTARARFRSRSAVCLAAFIGLSLGLVALLSWLFSVFYPSSLAMFVADVVAIGISYVLYSQWYDQPIRIRCDACRKTLLSNTPWVCGFCKESNRNANEFPFVHKCSHCGDEAKSYRCHHCGEVIYLTEDHDRNNYAHSVNAPSEQPAPDEHQEKLKKLRESKEVKAAKLDIANVDAELLRLKKLVKPQMPKKKPAFEELKEQVEAEVEWDIAEHQIKELIKTEYADNPALQKRLRQALKHKLTGGLADR